MVSINRSHSKHLKVLYLIASVRTVNKGLNCCSLELRSITFNQKAAGERLRAHADRCCVSFGFPGIRRFPVSLTDKKAWQDFIPLLEHLEEKSQPSRFPKTTLLLIYPLTVFSLAVTHSHYELILIKAVGSEIQLKSKTVIQGGCNILDIKHHFSKTKQKCRYSLHVWARGIRKCVCLD